MARVEISVVVPVYGCVECVEPLHRRLSGVLASLTRDYEIVYVDDRSPDGAWTRLSGLAAEDDHVVALRLSRNFGQHAAITAGLQHVTGRWTVVMDCDLQDPPEIIPQLYAKAEEGYDVVLSRRVGRRHSLFRRTASSLYFGILNRLAGTLFDAGVGNFSIISDQVRREFLGFQDKDRHYLMIIAWLGFSQAWIDYPHADRYAGKSTYSLRALIRFAFEGLFFQTTNLLRWIVYAGFGLSSAGVLLALFLVIRWFYGVTYPGWTSLAVLQLVIGGFIVFSGGIVGLYIGKIFNQVKNRPIFVVDEIRCSRKAVGQAYTAEQLVGS